MAGTAHSFAEYEDELYNPDSVPDDVLNSNLFYTEYFHLRSRPSL